MILGDGQQAVSESACEPADMEDEIEDPEVIRLLLEEELEALVEHEELLAMQQELKLRIQAEKDELEHLQVCRFFLLA